MTRRTILRALGAGGLGAGGGALLAACGETQIVEVEKVVKKIVEVPGQLAPVALTFATDHTAGPRGHAVQWAVERYANGEPDVGIQFFHDAVFEHEVAVPIADVREIRGEFSTPFTAGIQAYYLTERVRQTARPLVQIKDRFEWSLAPVPVNPATGKSGTFWSCQFHAVTSGAEARGNVAETAEVCLYFGSEVQHRVAGVDRGHLPMWRPALETAEAQSGPPNNMHYLKQYADGTENRHRQYRMPNWGEWYQSWIGLEQLYMLGEVTLDEMIQNVKTAAEGNQALQIDEMHSRGWI